MFRSKAEMPQTTGPLKGLGKLVSDRGRGRQNQSMTGGTHTHLRQGSGDLWDEILWIFQLSSIQTCWVI